MKNIVPILSITGSDSTSGSGIQADVKTIFSLGGYAVTALTTITAQNSKHILSFENISADLVVSQVKAVLEEIRPKAVKIGLVRDYKTVKALSNEIIGLRHIVVDAGFFNSRGERLIGQEVINAFKEYIFHNTEILIIKIKDAEILTGGNIISVQDMQSAALKILEMGVGAVLLQGGHSAEGIVTDIFISNDEKKSPLFFTSPDTAGWNFHGVAGNLSSATATFLAKGETLKNAVVKAHEYIRSLIVYSVALDSANIIRHIHDHNVSSRHVEIYNKLMSLVAEYYMKAKDVNFYAEKLNITPRYLSQITQKIVDKSPKKLIGDYMMKEIEDTLLSTSLTVQEAAYKFGFSSQAAFCKFFKAQKGISPKEFRTLKKI